MYTNRSFTLTEIKQYASAEQIELTVLDLRLLLGDTLYQLEEERKRSEILLSRVKDLESHILTYTQVISQLLNQLLKKVIL